MQKLWVVMGGTGEYSDRREWPVRAYMHKAAAEAEIVKLDAQAKEIWAAKGENYYPKVTNELRKHLLDPNVDFDYTGTSYFYYEVELANG